MREREATHPALRAAELEAVLDSIADGLVVYGPGGEVRGMNEAALRYVAGEGAVGLPADGPHFVDADGRPLAPGRSPVERALAGETVRALHLRTSEPISGRAGWVAASAAPLRRDDGEIAGAVLTFSDETGVYRLQDERDDLLRAIAHDLRTPLNAIYLQAHLVEQGAGGPERAAERGRAIARSCERMSDMLQELVESAMLEAGRLHFAPQPVDVAAFTVELLQRLRGGLDVDRIRFGAEPDLPRAIADPKRLERIVVNLVSNALKYSPAQAPVEVRVAASEGGIELSVADRGVGITPEDQVHLFERWFRAKGTRRPEGLGLGLYVTRLLVEAQRGRIRVETAPGRGSTFRVTLPAAGRTPGG
ncbi:MAG TPA: ATP-binding protein [Anaeromyxobacteraceae bacterium]|nr:ATP-binding protein [Anaeromyxobacteraceae bacterium]